MTVWVVAVVAAGLFGLIAKWLVLRFLWRIYKRNGKEDMLAAAEALRQVRAWDATKELAARRIRRAANPDRR